MRDFIRAEEIESEYEEEWGQYECFWAQNGFHVEGVFEINSKIQLGHEVECKFIGHRIHPITA